MISLPISELRMLRNRHRFPCDWLRLHQDRNRDRHRIRDAESALRFIANIDIDILVVITDDGAANRYAALELGMLSMKSVKLMSDASSWCSAGGSVRLLRDQPVLLERPPLLPLPPLPRPRPPRCLPALLPLEQPSEPLLRSRLVLRDFLFSHCLNNLLIMRSGVDAPAVIPTVRSSRDLSPMTEPT